MRDATRRRSYARHRREPAIHVLTPLAIGGLIYILWRSDSLLMFRWFEALGVAKLVAQLRVFAAGFHRCLPGWLLFSAPNALWAYSFTAFMTALWGDSSARGRLCWMLAGPTVGVGLEVGQACHLVRGTFDFVDVVSSLLAGSAALFFVKRDAGGGEQ